MTIRDNLHTTPELYVQINNIENQSEKAVSLKESVKTELQNFKSENREKSPKSIGNLLSQLFAILKKLFGEKTHYVPFNKLSDEQHAFYQANKDNIFTLLDQKICSRDDIVGWGGKAFLNLMDEETEMHENFTQRNQTDVYDALEVIDEIATFQCESENKISAMADHTMRHGSLCFGNASSTSKMKDDDYSMMAIQAGTKFTMCRTTNKANEIFLLRKNDASLLRASKMSGLTAANAKTDCHVYLTMATNKRGEDAEKFFHENIEKMLKDADLPDQVIVTITTSDGEQIEIGQQYTTLLEASVGELKKKFNLVPDHLDSQEKYEQHENLALASLSENSSYPEKLKKALVADTLKTFASERAAHNFEARYDYNIPVSLLPPGSEYRKCAENKLRSEEDKNIAEIEKNTDLTTAGKKTKLEHLQKKFATYRTRQGYDARSDYPISSELRKSD
ncbi:MAG: hypothetical protein LBI69_00800 [Puniceicoccales bacterium]|jgi:hypothetical protein|nr:hypothetical protein [Puniceicoccales bacterium]